MTITLTVGLNNFRRDITSFSQLCDLGSRFERPLSLQCSSMNERVAGSSETERSPPTEPMLDWAVVKTIFTQSRAFITLWAALE